APAGRSPSGRGSRHGRPSSCPAASAPGRPRRDWCAPRPCRPGGCRAGRGSRLLAAVLVLGSAGAVLRRVVLVAGCAVRVRLAGVGGAGLGPLELGVAAAGLGEEVL